MKFKQITPKITTESVKSSTKLNSQHLKNKELRDKELENIIRGKDDRLLLIIGPCSSDNPTAALEYAYRLAKLQKKVKDKIFLVMRVHTAKFHANEYYDKGLIHDPDYDGKSDLINGIKMARDFHYKIITETGLTTADEMLYPELFPLFEDLVSYLTIGPLSVANQQHHFVSSGSDIPVGFKNSTSGNINVMFNGLYAAQNEQEFFFKDIGIRTDGNLLCHVILCGGQDSDGKNQPNYYTENLLNTIQIYKKKNLKNPFIIIDTNHNNSGKKFDEQICIVRQTFISRDWNEEIRKKVRGFMIESYLEDGHQYEPDVFDKSITDTSFGWNKTEILVTEIYNLYSREVVKVDSLKNLNN